MLGAGLFRDGNFCCHFPEWWIKTHHTVPVWDLEGKARSWKEFREHLVKLGWDVSILQPLPWRRCYWETLPLWLDSQEWAQSYTCFSILTISYKLCVLDMNYDSCPHWSENCPNNPVSLFWKVISQKVSFKQLNSRVLTEDIVCSMTGWFWDFLGHTSL